MALHYLDQSRPRISGLPAFAPGNSRVGMSIIPGLHCAPRGDDGQQMEISGFFSRGPNTSSRKAITIPTSEFAAFWQRWLSDPEGVAEREFGWDPTGALTQGPAAKSKPGLLTAADLLDDLDLDDLS